MSWHMPVITTLETLKQGTDCDFKTNMGCKVILYDIIAKEPNKIKERKYEGRKIFNFHNPMEHGVPIGLRAEKQ